VQTKTIPETFWEQVSKSGEGKVALRRFEGNRSTDFSWAEYGEQVSRFALGLISIGLQPGDKVAIIGANRPEWLEADLGVICAGAISVPIYLTLPPRQIQYILEHSETRFIVVENQELMKTILELKDSLPLLERIIIMEGIEGAPEKEVENEEIIPQGKIRELGKEKDSSILNNIAANISPQDTFTIVYTSGTTGFPKGVMITHHNILSAVQTLTETVGISIEENQFTLSFLPLAHIAERMLSCFISAYLGTTVCFGKGLDTLPEDLHKTRPTVFFAVPRLYEKFYEAITKRIQGMEGIKSSLARWAIKVGYRRVNYIQSDREVPSGLQWRYRLAQRLVFSKLKESIGLDRIKVIASGAAPIKKEILEFFHAIDIPVREIYGQTESCAVTTIHRNERIKLGNVGQPFPNLQLKLDEDGEVMIKGDQIFVGYYKDEKATQKSFSGDWFHTGDVGELDEEGFLTITDRKKDILITAGGKNIAPQPIENSLKMHEHISNAIVIGDKRPYLVALITLDEDTLVPWAKEKGLKFKNLVELTALPEVNGIVKRAVEETNAQLGRFETIKKWKVLPHDFKVETGDLTPTLKIKRHIISKNYQHLIEKLYQ